MWKLSEIEILKQKQKKVTAVTRSRTGDLEIGRPKLYHYATLVTLKMVLSEQVSLSWKLPLWPPPPTWAYLELAVDVVKVDALARQKNSKRHFLEDISKSFQEVTPMGPEPHQFFSFSNISTNMVARGIQSFGQNGPWLAGWLSNGQNFFLKFAQTWDEQMLKISSRYLDSYLI